MWCFIAAAPKRHKRAKKHLRKFRSCVGNENFFLPLSRTKSTIIVSFTVLSQGKLSPFFPTAFYRQCVCLARGSVLLIGCYFFLLFLSLSLSLSLSPHPLSISIMFSFFQKSRSDKQLLRPLYERYRVVKKCLQLQMVRTLLHRQQNGNVRIWSISLHKGTHTCRHFFPPSVIFFLCACVYASQRALVAVILKWPTFLAVILNCSTVSVNFPWSSSSSLLFVLTLGPTVTLKIILLSWSRSQNR